MPRRPPPPSRLEDHLGFWLRFVSNHVSSRFAHHVEAQGVTVSEWVALRALHDEPRATTTYLLSTLGMTKGAVSKVVDRLEQKGLARRTTDPEDARARRVALTAAGRALVPRLAAIADENDAHFFDALPQDARDALDASLRLLVTTHGLTRVPTE